MNDLEQQEEDNQTVFIKLGIFVVAMILATECGAWIIHKMTTYPVTNRTKILREIRYCDRDKSRLAIVQDGTVANSILFRSLDRSSSYDLPDLRIQSIFEVFDDKQITLTKTESICTLTIADKKEQK
ncbi:hypothetical protein [Burkholderia sp. LMG 13014]|uniref:hypothetical protein n=1 Tax=Burkholderia sp. LMG 13014 TaxID=2709306 RepID=UPI001963C6F8|nr:hypothetical protein [Burkholderia sp. LMG 13014]